MTYNKATALVLLSAAAKSGNPDAILLAAQLAEAAPCKTCGYVHFHCRCGIPALPINMVLFCPACGVQHIDAPEPRDPGLGSDLDDVERWTNPPHRSHLCASCGHIWRPADVPTNGVAAVETKGKNDSALVYPTTSVTRDGITEVRFFEPTKGR